MPRTMTHTKLVAVGFRLGTKVGQIGQMGQIRDFSDQISVHFGAVRQNVLKSDLKKNPRIFPIWGPIWTTLGPNLFSELPRVSVCFHLSLSVNNVHCIDIISSTFKTGNYRGETWVTSSSSHAWITCVNACQSMSVCSPCVNGRVSMNVCQCMSTYVSMNMC